MALTYKKLPDGEDRVGRRKFQYWDVTLDSSYPTGGEVISPAKIGLKIIEGVKVIARNTAAASYVAAWNKATGKLQVYTGALAEVANGTDLSTLQFRLLFIGK